MQLYFGTVSNSESGLKKSKVSVTVLDEFIDEPKETFEEEQARKKAAIQAMFDWADRVHCKSTESWTRE